MAVEEDTEDMEDTAIINKDMVVEDMTVDLPVHLPSTMRSRSVRCLRRR
jgi:hypothetical protein